MIRLALFVLFGVAVLEKVFGAAWTQSHIADSSILTFLYTYIKPQLDLIFVLGCAWVAQRFIRRFLFGDYS